MKTAATGMRDPANWIVAFSLLVIAVNGFIFRGHELDDALIYARYIQNLISGNGFVYNAGEAVNGLTSPLFAYLSLELHPPDYILAREPPRFYERAVTRLRNERPGDLLEVASFDIPDFKLYRYLPQNGD